MKYEQLVGHFGGLTKAAQALGLKRQTVHAWGIRKRIPSRWQMRIAALTGGELSVDRATRKEAQALAEFIGKQSP